MAGKREVWLQVASASSSKHFHITAIVILKTGDMYCSVDIWFRRFLSAAAEETQRSAADKSDQILSLICLNWCKAELNCCGGGGWHDSLILSTCLLRLRTCDMVVDDAVATMTTLWGKGGGVIVIRVMPKGRHFFFRKPSFMQSSVKTSNFHMFNTI